MSICQLIYKELETLQKAEVVDINALNPRDYDILIGKSSGDIAQIKQIAKITDLEEKSLAKIDNYWKEKEIDVGKIGLQDLFTDTLENICDTTIFFTDSIIISLVIEKLGFRSSLPQSLRIAEKFLSIQNTEKFTSVDLDHINGFVRVLNAKNLTSILIGENKGFILVQKNPDLKNLSISKTTKDIKIHSNGRLETLSLAGDYYDIEIIDNKILPAINLNNVEKFCKIEANLGLINLQTKNIGMDILIKNNPKLENILTGDIKGRLRVVENRSLRNLKIGNVGIDHLYEDSAIICDNPSLNSLDCGHFSNSLELRNNPSLELENISSIHGEKIKIRGELILDKNQFTSVSNEEILHKFDIDPTRIIRN